MKELYSESDFTTVSAIRKKLIIIYVLLAVLLVGLNVPIFIFRSYNKFWFCVLNILLTAGFLCFSLFFFSIKFRLTHKYYKMLKNFRTGVLETGVGVFSNFDETLADKEGVEFYSMVTEERVIKRTDHPFRRVLIDKTREKPQITEGDKVKYITHAGILIRYEIIESGVALGEMNK